jgi:hypothetical protein
MRAVLFLIAVAAATPVLAAPKPAPPRPAETAPAAPIAVPPALSDPALPAKLGRMTGALARAMMELPIGEFEAAIENRPVTPADSRRKVRDVAAADDPQFEQRIAAEAAVSGQTMQAASKALIGSLPAILGAMEGARAELEKAVGNLPDPTYPKR